MTEEATERRQGRAAAETQRRRRRGDENLSASRKMPIPPEVQEWADREGMRLRWVNDEGDRIRRLTQYDDYDPVKGVDPVPTVTDRKAGTVVKAHLLAKPRAFIEEDRTKAEVRRKATEEALFRTPDAAAAVAGNPENPTVAPKAGTYVARGSKIGRNNQVLDG